MIEDFPVNNTNVMSDVQFSQMFRVTCLVRKVCTNKNKCLLGFPKLL